MTSNMNDVHRSVLLKHGMDLVRDMIPTESLLGAMFQRGIFDQELLDLIRACKTSSEQIYKILELLPKRGPDAFESFMDILQEQYHWLAKLLQESLASETAKLAAKKEEAADSALVTPRAISSIVVPDGDIRSRVSCFVQKQFGQVRRISNTDKKAIERWLSEWLHQERKRLMKALDDKNSDISEEDFLDNPEVKEKIYHLYNLLNRELKKESRIAKLAEVKPTSDHPDEPMDDDEKIVTPNNASFEDLQTLLGNLLNKIQYMEKQIGRCYDYIGDHQRSKDISLVVHELCGEYRFTMKELRKEKQKIEDILMELYNSSTQKNKQQNTISMLEQELILLKEQLNRLRSENTDMIKEITVLEKMHQTHLEKEKTLDELRKAKDDLQTMMKVVNEENKNLKLKLETKPQQNKYRGIQTRRNSIIPISNVANNRLSPRKVTVPKRRP